MKHMIRITMVLFWAGVMVLGLWAPSFALRCGTRLVSSGDTKFEVLQKCGEPDFVDSWERRN